MGMLKYVFTDEAEELLETVVENNCGNPGNDWGKCYREVFDT
jgi:hypothetical protein